MDYLGISNKTSSYNDDLVAVQKYQQKITSCHQPLNGKIPVGIWMNSGE